MGYAVCSASTLHSLDILPKASVLEACMAWADACAAEADSCAAVIASETVSAAKVDSSLLSSMLLELRASMVAFLFPNC